MHARICIRESLRNWLIRRAQAHARAAFVDWRACSKRSSGGTCAVMSWAGGAGSLRGEIGVVAISELVGSWGCSMGEGLMKFARECTCTVRERCIEFNVERWKLVSCLHIKYV